MQRIQIIGGSNAGKTTLGRKLAGRLGLPFTDLDDLWWEPGWRQVGAEEMARRLAPVTAGPCWLITGNYLASSRAVVWPRLTLLIVLDLPYPLMLWRALARTVRRGLTRAPCCNGNRESLLRLFHRDGVVRYLARTWRARHALYARLHEEPALRGVAIVHVRSPRDAGELARTLGAGPAPCKPFAA
jgi:adenylate kinase family enzyme